MSLVAHKELLVVESIYSLWVTDPYDLEIGSSKATRFSCPRSKAK